MTRLASVATVTAIAAMLVASVALQVWLLPMEVSSIVATFPEVAPLSAPAIVWEVLAIVCWQAIGVITLRMLARPTRPVASARRALRAMVGLLIAYLALDATAFVALTVMDYATPGVMLGLVVTALIAGAGAAFVVTRTAFHATRSPAATASSAPAAAGESATAGTAR